MQISALETFLAIASSGSFHAAARHLNVTQTTVSARIKALESALGAQLFERGRGGTRLSAAGLRLMPHAEQMLRSWDFVSAEIASDPGARGALRLGAQLSLWDALLADTAIWLERERGVLPFTLNYDHMLDMGDAVAGRLLDLALVHERPSQPGVEVVDLADERLTLVADRPLRLGPDEMPLFINLAFCAEYDRQWQQVMPPGSRQHIVLGNTAMGLRYLMRRGGVGYFPDAMIDGPLARGRLHAVAGAPTMRRACRAIYLRDNPGRAQIEAALEGVRALRDSARA